ncbi:MAG: methionine--tRNA ligase [Rickettsiaceae bacterium]|nr:MAG: methionine--tRNA ligase [Rickettsiaceae bacterium]
MKNTFYITTPIYYVNDIPHVGHAYTSVAADVIARFMRLSNQKVMFLAGTDEHGQKVEQSAVKMDMEPQAFTDLLSSAFINLTKTMNISNDDFIRTTEDRHKVGVAAFWQKLINSKNIYLGKYSGWYSIRDEAFYNQSELTLQGTAPTGAPVEWIEEPSYFFALSKWQDKLLDFYENNPDFIKPKSRYNEVVSFVKSGLTDLSISRTSFNWGIKVPDNDQHIIYVWLDALTNYISALGYPNEDNNYSKFWPADVHIVGKDILRFHAVYWPAFLMAAGLELPKCVMAHGWWTNEGHKMSKSTGNVIDPCKLIEEFGLDQVRYFMMREINFGNDGNFSRQSLIDRVNSELSNKIGNLLQRTLVFTFKNNNNKVPNVDQNFIDLTYDTPIIKNAIEVVQANAALMTKFEINAVIDNILSLVEEANCYIDKQAPWKLKIENPQKMLEVLYVLLESLRYIAIMLQPFIPHSAAQMLDQLGITDNDRNFVNLDKSYAMKPNSDLQEPYSIFPRINHAN